MDKTEETQPTLPEAGSEVEIHLDENSTPTNTESSNSATEEAAEAVTEAMQQIHAMEIKTMADVLRTLTQAVAEVTTLGQSLREALAEANSTLDRTNDLYAEAVEVAEALREAEPDESTNSGESEPIGDGLADLSSGATETVQTTTKKVRTGLRSIL